MAKENQGLTCHVSLAKVTGGEADHCQTGKCRARAKAGFRPAQYERIRNQNGRRAVVTRS